MQRKRKEEGEEKRRDASTLSSFSFKEENPEKERKGEETFSFL